MSQPRSPIERMIDQACGYNPDAIPGFTPEQDAILTALSKQDEYRFAIGAGAAISYVRFANIPTSEIPETLVDWMQSFMSDEPLTEDANKS